MMAEGIETRHSRSCRSRSGGRCNCRPTFRATIWSNRDGKRIRRSFASPSEARAWRGDALRALHEGSLRVPATITVREAVESWLAGAEAGTVRDRSGREYKGSTIRGYRSSLQSYILPTLGSVKLSELRRGEVQALADDLLGAGLSPSTVRNTLDPLRAVLRRAVQRELVAINPTVGLDVPASRRRRERIATPAEAWALLGALPEGERGLWATAFFAGLRRGELRALRWADVNLGASLIRIERSWDAVDGPIEPKSAAGARTVPLLAVLRDYLDEHKLRTGRDGEDLVFGRTPTLPFIASTVRSRALRAWREAGLEPIGLHECRHSFATMLIAAGQNPKAVTEYMGHATVAMSFDRYGHLFPGSRDEARATLDAYLEDAVWGKVRGNDASPQRAEAGRGGFEDGFE
jgi:integrase